MSGCRNHRLTLSRMVNTEMEERNDESQPSHTRLSVNHKQLWSSDHLADRPLKGFGGTHVY
jgi:hypothetical protein